MLVTKVWSQQPGKFFCLSTRAKSSSRGPLKNHWFERYEFHLVAKKIRQLRDHCHVWWCAHGFKDKHRQTDVAEPSHFLYADLDGVHPNNCPVPPTMAVESSPGRYVGYWFVGEAISWDDNQAWTKLIKADPGGWDPTQVLRAPTSYNHKHPESPKVKTLWHDGAQYKLKDIRKRLPLGTAEVTATAKTAGAVYKKWEKIIPAIFRKGLLSKVQTEKDRSDWMWRVGGDLMLNGVPTDDIFTLLWASGNNKYRDRRNGEKALRREIDRKLESKLKRSAPKTSDDDDDDEEDYELFTRSMAEVEAEDIDWLYEPFIARGEVTILEGDPGVGKSLLMQKIAVAAADGKPLPGDMRDKEKPLVVFFLDHENSSATVMKPRLSHNGLLNPHNVRQEEKSFDLEDEKVVEKIHEAIKRYKCGLVVFDTLMNYSGKANTNNAAETSRVMGTFRNMAQKFNIPVVVLRHLTKDNKTKASYRGQGSIAFTGSARTVIGVGYAGDNPDERLFKITKSNLTDIGARPAQRFRMITEDKKISVTFTGVAWVSNDELLNTEPPKAGEDAATMEKIVEVLKERPHTMGWILKTVAGYGHTEAAIARAARYCTVTTGKLSKGEPLFTVVG